MSYTKKSSKIDLAILGGGRSGLGAALLAHKQGLVPFVSDSASLDDTVVATLEQNNIDYESGGHGESKILEASEVIKSPGIPEEAPIIQKINRAGIPVIGEIEFAARFTEAKLIAITGTNGKTTTTLLTHHLLKNAGFNVGLGGNVGQSFALSVARETHDYYVLELSSFQLDSMYEFKADLGVLLNITPDHLKRYGGEMLNYIRSKFRILQNMDATGGFIYFKDDQNIAGYLQNMEEVNAPSFPCKLPVTMASGQKNLHDHFGAVISQDAIKINTPADQGDFRIATHDLPLTGDHNKVNIAAGVLCAKWFKADNDKILNGLKTFRNVPHRLEWVREVDGINFYNDSKATNVEAVYYALEAVGRQLKPAKNEIASGGIIWIAGGEDKGNDYTLLFPLVKQYVKALIGVGKDNTPLLEAFEDKIKNIQMTDKMEEAVNLAYHKAEQGDVILLSPACASFDLFDNYEQRGEVFKQFVNKLIKDGIKL